MTKWALAAIALSAGLASGAWLAWLEAWLKNRARKRVLVVQVDVWSENLKQWIPAVLMHADQARAFAEMGCEPYELSGRVRIHFGLFPTARGSK